MNDHLNLKNDYEKAANATCSQVHQFHNCEQAKTLLIMKSSEERKIEQVSKNTYLHRVLVDRQLHAGLTGAEVFAIPNCSATSSHAFDLVRG